MRRKLLKFVLLFAVIWLNACKSNNNEETVVGVDDVIPVKILTIKMEDASHTIAASGQFTTNDETILSFKNGGIINKIYVKEGDAVKNEQLLATVIQTEIGAQVEQATLSYQKAERDFSRATKLYKDSVATLEQMQNAQTAFKVAEQQLNAVKFNKNHSEIRATSNGFVLRKLANDGQVVGPGTPILQINGANENRWVLKVGLSDQQWSILKIGDGAIITTDALANQKIEAKVTRKAEAIDPQSGTFLVELTLLNHIKGLAAGLFGKALITPTKTSGAVSIPYDAILDAGENEGYVFITNDQKTAKKIKVQLGAIQNDKISILSGLDNAKSLIVSGSAYLTEGSKIKIIN